jgi:hypothetical protein
MDRNENRLQKLELKRNPPQRVVATGLCTVAHSLPAESKTNPAVDERVVIDWYLHKNGVAWGKERITKDPADQGRCCKRDGYLLDVLLELHEACPHCEQVSSCCTCAEATVAKCQTEPPEDE